METTIPIAEARERLGELAERAEGGETIVVTRDGKPVFDIVPHHSEPDTPAPSPGLDLEAYRRKYGLTPMVAWIADDFDDPLPEDFLLRPLPPDP